MTKLSTSLKSYAKVLQSKFNAAKAGITDSDVKGNANEKIIADFLKESVPNWFISTNSQIIDSHDNSSNELDICVCNKHQFLMQPNGGVLIAEGIDFVVQVKAVLTDDELNRIIKSCGKVKRLKKRVAEGSAVYLSGGRPHGWMDYIPYFCFAFSSQLTPETIAEKLNKKLNEIKSEHQIDGLCILDREASLFGGGRYVKKDGNYPSGWIALKTGEATLLEFVRNCIDYVPRIKYPHPPIANYFPKNPGYKYIGGGMNRFKAYYSCGVGKYELGQYKEAIADFNKAIALKPDCTEAYFSRGSSNIQLRQYERAIVDLNKAIALKPDYVDAYCSRGYSKAGLHKYKEAIADFNKAIALKPDCTEAYFSRGSSNIQLRQYEEAIVDLNKAIALKPDYVNAYCGRGYSKAELHKYKEAIIDLNKAIALKPDHSKAYLNRGMVQSRLKQHKEAITDFNKAIALKPNEALAYYNRGSAWFQLCQYKEAIIDLNKAIELDSNHALAYYNRGIVKEQLKGQRKEAIIDLEKAIELDSNLELELRPIITELKSRNPTSE